MTFENDTISVKSKRSASEHIIGCYSDFGWTLEKKEDDKLYDNIIHLTFTRPHFIENRDELQLLQVRLEIAYNAMGTLSAKIPRRASLFGILFGLLALCYTALGVLMFVLVAGTLPVIFGVLSCAVAIVFGVSGAVVVRKTYKRDSGKYRLLIEEQVKRIEELCISARALRGEYGQKD